MSNKIWKIDKILSDNYDDLCLNLPHYVNTQKTLSRIIENIHISSNTSFLEVGCGTGIMTGHILFNSKLSKVTAIEPDKNMIKKAIKRTRSFGERVFFINIDILSYVQECKSRENFEKFDYVICTFTLHNLHIDVQREVLKSLRLIIKDSGSLFIADYMVRSGFRRVDLFMNHIDELFNALIPLSCFLLFKEWVKHTLDDYSSDRILDEENLYKIINESKFGYINSIFSGNLETIINCKPV